jgi:hypothetical protein
MVYVVSLGYEIPDKWKIGFIDIVTKQNKYFHPIGEKGFPKEPPNYIGFRYQGKLQSIHYIKDYVVFKNPHDFFPEIPSQEWSPHFLYTLGDPIKPQKTVKTGKVYPNGRVWCMFDTLFTSDTISESRDITRKRLNESK